MYTECIPYMYSVYLIIETAEEHPGPNYCYKETTGVLVTHGEARQTASLHSHLGTSLVVTQPSHLGTSLVVIQPRVGTSLVVTQSRVGT